MDAQADPFRSYVFGLLGLVAIALTGTFTLNAIADPLWHFKGNRLHDVSYRFEERTMKLNYFLNHSDEYDCLIFGASRATLVDESLIEDSACYNMAFSLGHVSEFRMIAEYLKSRGYVPERVIVSIDEISFQPWTNSDGQSLPQYVRAMERPKWPIEDYLGLTPLKFSIETILQSPTFIRAYQRRDDGSYQGVLLPTERAYDPKREMLVPPSYLQPYDATMLDEFERLRDVFPDAEYQAYVSPISDWRQARIDLTGNLETYIALRHELAPVFEDGYWDFSVPSNMTADTSQTFDGQHYQDETNRVIALCLNGDLDMCGPDVRSLTLEEYRQLILPPIRARIEREGLTATVSENIVPEADA